jgi:hypothetical protein
VPYEAAQLPEAVGATLQRLRTTTLEIRRVYNRACILNEILAAILDFQGAVSRVSILRPESRLEALSSLAGQHVALVQLRKKLVDIDGERQHRWQRTFNTVNQIYRREITEISTTYQKLQEELQLPLAPMPLFSPPTPRKKRVRFGATIIIGSKVVPS